MAIKHSTNNSNSFGYDSDSELISKEHDKLNRWNFSKKISNLLSTYSNPDSLVIGIYGEWGEGKSTVLNFIEQDLRANAFKDIVVIRFNPWKFSNENDLLLSFFNALDRNLRKLFTDENKRQFGELLKNYVTHLIPSMTFDVGILKLKTEPSKIVESIGEYLLSPELDEIKDNLEELLIKKKKNIVFIFDDLDRCDIGEIQSVFKLIKLVANFKYVRYLLAIDDKSVVNALKEKYGEGGYDYLEKIVQVPMYLPKPDLGQLINLLYFKIQEALSFVKIYLSEDDIHNFYSTILKTLSISITNPRMIIRYKNNLITALIMLKDEVNHVDLMLLEGVKLFYPEVYKCIRFNCNIFFNAEKNTEDILKLLNVELQKYNEHKKEAAKEVLQYLFPPLRNAYSRGRAPEDFSNQRSKWENSQRLISPHYFYRYFQYSLQTIDISDSEFASFLNELASLTDEQITKKLKNYASSSSRRLLEKLENLNIREHSTRLIKSLAKIADAFTVEETLFFNTYKRIAILFKKMLGTINEDARIDVAYEILKSLPNVKYYVESYIWMFTPENRQEQQLFIRADEIKLFQFLLKRIQNEANDKPIYVVHPKEEVRAVFQFWGLFEGKEAVQSYMKPTLEENEHNVFEFLKCYFPTDAFQERFYTLISEVIEPEYIEKQLKINLKKKYNSLLNMEQHHISDIDDLVAKQFIDVHEKSKVKT